MTELLQSGPNYSKLIREKKKAFKIFVCICIHFKERDNHDINSLKGTNILKINREKKVLIFNCIHVYIKERVIHDSNFEADQFTEIKRIYIYIHSKHGQLNCDCGNSSIVKYVVSKSVKPQFSPKKHYIIVANKC